MNFINANYAVEFRGKGYTFLAISPGLVDTRTGPRKSVLPPTSRMLLANMLLLAGPAAEEAGRAAMIELLKAGYPDWNGVPLLPRQSAELVLGVIDRATPKESGGFVSQYGDKRWL